MTKKEIRKAALQQRKSLSNEEVVKLSTMLLSHFSKLDFSSIQTIHLFLPIEDKKEPDTFLIIDWLKVNHPGIKLLVPRADFESGLMTHHPFTTKDRLQKNDYNILEPQMSDVHQGDIDLVLVPLLAFDRLGYRVGYGKGFYDRFFEHADVLKIGLSFFEPLDSIEDKNEHDVRLDMCITPDIVYKF